MHEVSKRKEKEPQGDDAAMVSMQGRGGTTSTHKDTKTCYYCGKPGHIAVVNAAYTRNRCPSRALPSITPEEAWSGRKPCISHMRAFGCIAFAMVPDEKRGKLDAKGTKCLFIGYCEGTKAYRLMCAIQKDQV
jgi:hypothetical protein